MKTTQTNMLKPMACAVALAASQTAVAQSSVLEEVIVTAEKRAVSLQDVAVAVTAFDRDMRDELGILSNAELANFTPSTTFNTNPNRVFIRGVGRVENSLGSEPGVAVYRDGVYTNEIGGIPDSSFFTERVEVLRGPQGTLYGKNAVGGAANFISKRPDDEFGGEVRAGVYSNKGQQLGLRLSGPAGDRFRYLVGAEMDKNDGWVENIAGDDVNDRDIARGIIAFDFDLTDKLNVWMQYERQEWDQNRTGAYLISPYNTESPGPLVGDFFTDFEQLVPNAQFGYEEANPGADDIHKVNWDNAGYIEQKTDLFTAHVSYEFEKATLRYIYGYTDYTFDFGEDLDKTSRDDIQYETYLGQYEQSDQHELQLISNLGGKVEFIAGLFYWKSENEQPLQAFVPGSTLFPTPVIADPAGDFCYCVIDAPANPNSSYYEQNGILETKSQAVYGQVDFYPTEKWHLSLGLRYSEDEKEAFEYGRAILDDQGVYSQLFTLIGMSWLNTETPTPGPQSRIAWDITAGGGTAEHEDDWSSTDWSVGLDYTFDNETMLYGKISTGYKAGGYILGNLQPDNAVDEESVVAYELGVKSQSERVRTNAALYYYDYTDMQVPVNVFNNGVTTRRFENAEEAEVWGAELELQWAATDSLMFYGSYSYMDTEIKTMGQEVFDSTEAIPEFSDLAGNELIQSPEHHFSLIGDYTWSLEPGDIKFVVSYAYKDKQWSSIFNREDTQVESFDRTDLRLNFLSSKYDLRVTAYVQNVFDEDIIESKTRSSAYTNNQISASIQPPRICGLQVNYGF